MINPEFPEATEVVANVSTEFGYVELTPVEDEEPIQIIASKVVIDSISIEKGKIETEEIIENVK